MERTPPTFRVGNPVIVYRNEQHGYMYATVSEVHGNYIIVTPDHPVLRQWFTSGYKVGKNHYGTHVQPRRNL